VRHVLELSFGLLRAIIVRSALAHSELIIYDDFIVMKVLLVQSHPHGVAFSFSIFVAHLLRIQYVRRSYR